MTRDILESWFLGSPAPRKSLLVTGPTGSGKTATGVECAVACLRKGVTVTYFAVDPDAVDVGRRLASAAGKDWPNLRPIVFRGVKGREDLPHGKPWTAEVETDGRRSR